jgi:hypothetical protein
MSAHDDQPRPALDAAIDAALPALTALSDQVVAASLRQTRGALAGANERLRSGALTSRRRWVMPAAATVAAVVAVIVTALLRGAPSQPAPLALRPAAPTLPLLAPRTSSVVSATAHVVPPVRPTRVSGGGPGRAVGPATAKVGPRRDPLEALVAAMQAIPADDWHNALGRAASPVVTPEVSIPPIHVSPIATAPLGDLPAERFVPGEP